jgi:hypothetical protein
MTQSQEELLPIQDVANYLEMSEAYVLAKLRLRQFQQVIIEKKTPTGAQWTAHFYFDKTLWPFTDMEEVVVKDSNGQAITYMEGTQRKEVRDRIVRDVSGNEYVAKDDTVVCNRSENDWFYLEDPKDTKKKAWLDDAEIIYIPLAAVKAFQQNHGFHREVKTKNADKMAGVDPAPDLSKVVSDKWYPTSQAASFLYKSPKYLRNDLIPNKKLIAEKRGGRYLVSGQEILNYAKKYHTTGH